MKEYLQNPHFYNLSPILFKNNKLINKIIKMSHPPLLQKKNENWP